MIVCVCHNISESEIKAAIKGGMDDMHLLRENLGVGTCCGKCKSCTKKILLKCGAEHNKRRTADSKSYFISLTSVF